MPAPPFHILQIVVGREEPEAV